MLIDESIVPPCLNPPTTAFDHVERAKAATRSVPTFWDLEPDLDRQRMSSPMTQPSRQIFGRSRTIGQRA
jgi:hypothetical protein